MIHGDTYFNALNTKHVIDRVGLTLEFCGLTALSHNSSLLRLWTGIGMPFSLISDFKYHSDSTRLPETGLFCEIVPCLAGEYEYRGKVESRRCNHHSSSTEELDKIGRPQNENKAKGKMFDIIL